MAEWVEQSGMRGSFGHGDFWVGGGGDMDGGE